MRSFHRILGHILSVEWWPQFGSCYGPGPTLSIKRAQATRFWPLAVPDNSVYHGESMADSYKKKVRQVRTAIWILLCTIAGSTVVFYVIGGGRRSVFDSLWMTMQILTTTGDTGFARTHAEQVWSIVLMLVGVVVVFYLGVTVVAFVLDGELRALLGRRHLESKIKKMKDHFIICGFGRMGRALAEALDKKGASFVVIDSRSEATAEAEQQGYLYLQGDAMSAEVLEAAQIATAQGLASCLPEDSDNVFVTLTARDLNHELRIVAKANFEQTQGKLQRAGANHVLSPSKLAADRALTKFMLPAVDELLEIVVQGPDLEVSKVSLGRLPRATNRALRDLSLPQHTGLMVVAVVHRDGRRSFNPSPDTVLQSDDDLIVIGPQGGVNRMVETFGETA